jgi:subtilisin family serine protease
VRLELTLELFIQSFDSLVNTTVQGLLDPNDPEDPQGLYIVAGGNGGQYCASRQIENCNWFAAVTDKLRENGYPAGSRLIFVGSLDDNSNNLAGYSYFAGDLKEDFIVTYDDVFSPGDAAGTSFAAPRVAGAAALVKQKFPNLTSAQIKQVILQTADDLGATGVDAVFGYGKLNVLNTLSPQGIVVPK